MAPGTPATTSGRMLAAFLHGLIPEVTSIPSEIWHAEQEAVVAERARLQAAVGALITIRLKSGPVTGRDKPLISKAAVLALLEAR